jgi:two-component system KDP operon response regulator KdpE
MSPDSFAILIASGEPPLRELISKLLRSTGFRLEEAPDTQTALEMTKEGRFNLVLLDVNLPDKGGADACRRLRDQSPATGIVTIRTSGSEEDDWLALDAGADDCVAAPFRYREIVARISAVMRQPHREKARPTAVLRTGELELDLRRRLVRRNGKGIHLSPHEFDLLAILMANPGAALAHTKLARSAWGNGIRHNREYLRTYIQSLRQKLEQDPAHPRYIVTQPWVGYRFCEPLQHKFS